MPNETLPLPPISIPADAVEALALGWPLPDPGPENPEPDQNLWGV